MKYYKLTLEVFKNYQDTALRFAPMETEKCYVYDSNKVDIHGNKKPIYLPKSICKIESELYASYKEKILDMEVINEYHKVYLYIPCWWFGKNRVWFTLGELISQNNFYDKYEVVEF